MLDLGQQTRELWPEISQAIEKVINRGQFILGPEIKAFEEEAAAYLGAKYAVGVNSGTDALVIALRSLEVGPGDEVITTPFTFFATAEAISQVGATPVFVDIEPDTFNINPDLIEKAITPRTRAIIPVHLFGQAADMDRIMTIADEHGLKVIEDTAQAFGGEWKGRKLGTIGDMGCYSFFPTKNLSCFGDGGLIVTDNPELAEKARILRAHGSRRKYHNEILGYNSRLDEIQAAVLRVKLPHIDRWNRQRREAAESYRSYLSGINGIELPKEKIPNTHVYHQFTIRVKDGLRDRLKDRLEEQGIATMVYYPAPVHKLPVYNLTVEMPEAEKASREVLSLPLWPEISKDTIVYITETIKINIVMRN